ncbi:MAG: hypothetical protein JWQ09_918 [Segetibacter sp.]|nr:hypothetical protein [Segetibacter sp.]
MALSNSFKYATASWITSVVVSPVLLIAYDYFTLPASSKGIYTIGSQAGFIFFALLFGSILSLPVWLLLFLFARMINKTTYSQTSKKLFILAFTVFITGILFYILFASVYVTNMKQAMMSFPVFYLITIALAILIFKLKRDEEKV